MGSVKATRKKSNGSKQLMSANDFKLKGNKYYAAKNFAEAVTCYTKAIELNPNIAAFYTNRALCNINLRQWQLVCQDCRLAIELEPNQVKGHFYLGHALVEMRQFDEAIACLSKANDLSTNLKQSHGDDIQVMLRLAKKRKLLAAEEAEMRSLDELRQLLERLIVEKKSSEITGLTGTQLEEKNNHYDSLQEKLEELFKKSENSRKNRDIPDVLCGKISFELVREPVITPSGITYDRKDIEQHLQRVGHFDPITRQSLTSDQLIPNCAMKEVIDKYLEDNPWAEYV